MSVIKTATAGAALATLGAAPGVALAMRAPSLEAAAAGGTDPGRP
jgi:hypothetical protein